MPIKATISADALARFRDLLSDENCHAVVDRGIRQGVKRARMRLLAELRFHQRDGDYQRFVWSPPIERTKPRARWFVPVRFIRWR